MKSKTGSRILKQERVTEYLQNTLLPVPHGGRLPSIRAIMEKTGAGRLTVEHALEKLKGEGLIRVEPWRGIYRVKRRKQTREIRLIHFQKSTAGNSDFIGKLFRELTRRAERSGFRITIENAGNRAPEKIAGELAVQGVRGCILMGAPQPEFPRILKREVPLCLELLPRHTGSEVPSLRDSPEMTVIQISYLLKLGYRRIGYLHYGGLDMQLYPVHVLRLLDYYRLMAENGLRVHPDWVVRCSEKCENLASGMDRAMAADPPPEVIITSGGTLRRLYPWCRRHGIRIGTDLAVFCCDDINGGLKPEATTVTNNPESIAETFWEMFQEAERGGKVSSRFTQLSIRTGRTVPSRSIGHEG